MNQLTFTTSDVELDITTVDLSKLAFLDDASYEFVGGGEATNGY